MSVNSDRAEEPRFFFVECRERLHGLLSQLRNDAQALGDGSRLGRACLLAQIIKAGANRFARKRIGALAQELENSLYALSCGTADADDRENAAILHGFVRLAELMEEADSYSPPGTAGASPSGTDAGDAVSPAPIPGLLAGEPAPFPLTEKREALVDGAALDQTRRGGEDVLLLEFPREKQRTDGGESGATDFFARLESLVPLGRLLACAPDEEGANVAAAGRTAFSVLLASLLDPGYVAAQAQLPSACVTRVEEGAAGRSGSGPAAISRHFFGSVGLAVEGAKGVLVAPSTVDAPSLYGLKNALVAGEARCSDVGLALDGVAECDVFFCQLLCCACHAYAAQGKRLDVVRPLPEEVRAACSLQGFVCEGASLCLFDPLSA